MNDSLQSTQRKLMNIRLSMSRDSEFPEESRGIVMKKIFEFIQNEMPLGAMVFDENMNVIYQNSTAAKFLKRCGIAGELTALAEKIFKEKRAADPGSFSKDISFSGASKGMRGNLSIRCLYSEEPFPRVSVFISTKPCNRQLNAEEVIKRCDFTNKEAEILRQLVRGSKITDIARQLRVQKSTVRSHLKSIYVKCGVRSKLELVRKIIS